MAKSDKEQSKYSSPIGKALKGWIFGFLLPLICTLLVFLLLAPVAPFFLASELIKKYRHSCPVHKERLQFETVAVSQEEAELNRVRRSSLRGLKALWDLDYVQWRDRKFPYLNIDPPHVKKAGPHRRRFCPACRAAEAAHLYADYVNDPSSQFGRERDLEELQRKLEIASRE